MLIEGVRGIAMQHIAAWRSSWISLYLAGQLHRRS